MVDEMWLQQDVLCNSIPDCLWCIVCDNEDTQSIRLRREIVVFLRRQLTTHPQDAGVVLRSGSSVCGIDNADGYRICTESGKVTIESPSNRGLLYGLYAYVRNLQITQEGGTVVSSPNQSVRMIDHWDQIDGSIERGYAGESIFFGHLDSNNHTDFRSFPERDTSNPFRGDYSRLEQYARLMASIGINAICLNNVNVRGDATRLITHPFLDRVGDIARLFDEFGIRIFLAINFASPKLIGGLDTCDPCNDDVRAWWKHVVDEIYQRIPTFGGFVVKADSEGEAGPMQYGRDHADGANMLGEALAPHGGVVFWRAFVYNSRQDWRDRTTDRAKASYDNFIDLDGRFAHNVILQIKFGPMDFQTREPLNPLIGAMKHTNIVVEFQITAEYLGHQIDVNYVLPQWQEILHTDTMCGEDDARVCSVIRQRCLDQQRTGLVAVSNVGMDNNWTGNTLAQANLYGFGRLCWNNELTAESIADEWLKQTFPSLSKNNYENIKHILLTSNTVYEGYTAPLGVGFMVKPGVHYGPSVDGYEYDRWGTYHFADRDGVGVDRSVASGSGYTAQYPPQQAAIYEDISSTPDDVLLFFHHVPYNHVLHNGTTVIQHIYNTHFAGPDNVRHYIALWEQVRGEVPEDTFNNVAQRLHCQLNNAEEWRDQVNTFFYRLSKIPDQYGRQIYL